MKGGKVTSMQATLVLPPSTPGSGQKASSKNPHAHCSSNVAALSGCGHVASTFVPRKKKSLNKSDICNHAVVLAQVILVLI